MPVVSVRSSPNGLPIASTFMPTSSFEESPRGTGTRRLAGTLTWTTATSFEASMPTTLDSWVEPSKSVTWTESAPSMTWKLVRMCPLWSITNPEPVPLEVSSPKKPTSCAEVVMLTTLRFTAA